LVAEAFLRAAALLLVEEVEWGVSPEDGEEDRLLLEVVVAEDL
jgi:hypothetical protein